MYVYCVRELGLDLEKVNVNGGAIALGHPLDKCFIRIMLNIKLMIFCVFTLHRCTSGRHRYQLTRTPEWQGIYFNYHVSYIVLNEWPTGSRYFHVHWDGYGGCRGVC